MNQYCSIIIYGVIGDDVLHVPSYIREFFADYLEIPNIVIQYDDYELEEIMPFVKLEYPIYSYKNVFGLLVSMSEGKPVTVSLPSWTIRHRFKKLMLRYDLIPKYYHW